MEQYPNHPGFLATCPLRTTVTSARSDGAGGGYGCSFTGGHCTPCDECGNRIDLVKSHEDEERFQEEMRQLENQAMEEHFRHHPHG